VRVYHHELTSSVQIVIAKVQRNGDCSPSTTAPLAAAV